MNTSLKNKIVLGTTYKQHRKSKIYGKGCLKHLSLLKIILELKNYCAINLEHDQVKCLEQMAKDIQTKNKEICNYRNANHNDIKFIN